MDFILQTTALTKSFWGKVAVNKVHINVKKGDIYGIIGNHMSGKTTLLRLITGLCKTRNGTIHLFGSTDLKTARRKVGSLIDEPTFFENETVYDNLKYFSQLVPNFKRKDIESLINFLNLQGSADTKAYNLSPYERKIFGVAVALIGYPELVILDSPFAGLDYHRKALLCKVIRQLNSNGVTFVIADNQPDPLSDIATDFGIMVNGHLVEEVSAATISEKCKDHIIIVADNLRFAADILCAAYPMCAPKIFNNSLSVYIPNCSLEDIKELLTSKGAAVYSIEKQNISFSRYFSERMGG